MQDDAAWGYLQKLYLIPPKINMVVDYYHYETRTHVRESASDESTKTVTFKDEVSKKVLPLESWACVARLKIDESILFGDQETEDDEASEAVSPQMNQLRTKGVYPSQIAGCDWPLNRITLQFFSLFLLNHWFSHDVT